MKIVLIKINFTTSSFFLALLFRCVFRFPVAHYEYMPHVGVGSESSAKSFSFWKASLLLSFTPTVDGVFVRLPWLSMWKAFVVGLIAVVVVIFSWCIQISVIHVGRSTALLRIIIFFASLIWMLCLTSSDTNLIRPKHHFSASFVHCIQFAVSIHSAAACCAHTNLINKQDMTWAWIECSCTKALTNSNQNSFHGFDLGT